MRITIAFVVTNLVAFGFGIMFGIAWGGLVAVPVTAGAALLTGGTVGVVMMAMVRIAGGEDEQSPPSIQGPSEPYGEGRRSAAVQDDDWTVQRLHQADREDVPSR